MALTLANSNYNGDHLNVIYKVFDTGNEVAEQALAVIETGIKKKRSLPKLSSTDNPFGDYSADAPSADTTTITYAERALDPSPMQMFLKFLPEDFDDVWPDWQPGGDFTNATLNAELLSAILEINENAMGRQIAQLFYQGDTTLAAAAPMNKFNGLVTRAIADANVPKITPAGVITVNNVVAIVKDFWTNIPDYFINNPDYVMQMNMTDYRLLQLANIALKEAFEGVLDLAELNMFITTKIVPLVSMPKNYILGAVANVNRMDSNQFMGVDQDEKTEVPRIEKMANGSKYYFIRIDVKADANYREASELLLYKPA